MWKEMASIVFVWVMERGRIPLVFELGGVDLILGVSWLATLGDIKANWQSLTMQFQTKQGPVEIKGDPSLGKFIISPNKLLKLNY